MLSCCHSHVLTSTPSCSVIDVCLAAKDARPSGVLVLDIEARQSFLTKAAESDKGMAGELGTAIPDAIGPL